MSTEELPCVFSFESSLLSALKTLYEDQVLSDTIITVGEGQAQKEFMVHKCILCAQSPYFRRVFQENKFPAEDALAKYPESCEGSVFEKITPSAFNVVLKLVNAISKIVHFPGRSSPVIVIVTFICFSS
jgi:hypothetical protein